MILFFQNYTLNISVKEFTAPDFSATLFPAEAISSFNQIICLSLLNLLLKTSASVFRLFHEANNGFEKFLHD